MNMYSRKTGGGIIVLIVLILAANTSAMAAVTDLLDSSSFDYLYEFDVLPSEVDLDENGVADFTLVEPDPGTLLDGVYSMSSTAGNQAYFVSSAADQIWATSDITYATGYTIETRVRVNSTDPAASYGSAYVQASPGEATATAWLNLHAAKQSWGHPPTSTVNDDNSDDFHVFRIAQEPEAASFSVWRDDVLLYTEIGSGYNGTLDHLVLGDKSSSVLGGSIDYDYLRFTAGAYTPVEVVLPSPPATQLGSADFTYKYEMDVDPTDPNAINLDGNVDEFENPLADWTTIGTGSLALSGNGTLLIDSDGTEAYLGSGITESTNVWPVEALGVVDGFTIEFSMKVTAGYGDRAAMALVICPSDSTEMPIIEISPDGQSEYGYGDIGIEDATYDNSDDFHLFRVARNSQADGGGYFVWRDGELLTPEEGFTIARQYQRSSLSFGDVGGATYGGIAEIEYFRFMEGAFAPEEGTPPIAGDANNDGKVDGSDVTILAGNWQAGVGDPNPETVTWEMGDFNGDGQVDGSDVTILAGNWQAGVTSAAASVPEPSTILLILSAVAGMVLIRRRK